VREHLARAVSDEYFVDTAGDGRLPGLDRVEAAGRICTVPQSERVQIVVLTGWDKKRTDSAHETPEWIIT
jgi:hypothetical protein